MGFNLKGSSNRIIHFEHPNIRKVVRFNFQCGPCSHLGFQTCYFNCFKFSIFIIKKLPINNLEHFLSCKFQYTNFPLCYFILLVVISSTKYPLTLFLHFALFIIHHLHMFSHIFHHYHPCHQNIFLIEKLLCNFISIMLCSRYSGTHSYPLCIVLGLGLYIFSFDNYIHLCA